MNQRTCFQVSTSQCTNPIPPVLPGFRFINRFASFLARSFSASWEEQKKWQINDSQTDRQRSMSKHPDWHHGVVMINTSTRQTLLTFSPTVSNCLILILEPARRAFAAIMLSNFACSILVAFCEMASNAMNIHSKCHVMV